MSNGVDDPKEEEEVHTNGVAPSQQVDGEVDDDAAGECEPGTGGMVAYPLMKRFG